MKVKLEIEFDGATELAALVKGLGLLALRLSEPGHQEQPAVLRIHAKVDHAVGEMLSAKTGIVQ